MFNIFGNSSANDMVQWQPEPTTRGTFGVLSTCLITISLCIWTAIHLNIPRQSEKKSVQVWRKVKWLFIGLLAPEIVLFTAWYQYVKARKTAAVVSKKLSEHPRRTSSREIKTGNDVTEIQKLKGLEHGRIEPQGLKVTTKQGFFINMGGLAFDTKSAQGVFLPNGADDYWIVKDEGIDRLCELHPEILDTVTDRIIDDKSKTGNFGKVLVCLQTLWFIAQCISRLAQTLPISLLELNTFGHCLCALLIYCFWWNKPLDVERPVLIRGESYRETLAWMWMCSRPVAGIPGREHNHVRLVDRDNPRYAIEHNQEIGAVQVPDMFPQLSTQSSMSPETTLERGQELLDTRLRYFNPGLDHFPPSLNLSKVDVLRWQLASSRFLSFDHAVFPMIARRARNFTSPDDLTTTNKWLAWSVLLLASMVYGGLHALAWDVTFNSLAEQVLWRVSAITVMGYGFVVAGFWRAVRLDDKLRIYEPIRRLFGISDSSWSKTVKGSFGLAQRELCWLLHLGGNLHSNNTLTRQSSRLFTILLLVLFYPIFILSYPIMFFASLLYLVARAYLVVECFISLFHSPPGVYQQPVWASYFPHIG